MWPRPDARLHAFQQILLAALQTRGYRRTLHRAGLGEPAAIAGLSSIDEGLLEFPPLRRERFFGWPSDFRNIAASEPELQPLHVPLSGTLRTAVVSPGFTESDYVRRFDPSSIGSLRQFRPEALAGSLDALKQLGPAAPDRAVIVLTSLEDGSLCEAERELLWRIFEVPIFEQRIGADGSLLAWECEAHEGLHVVEENAIFEQSAQRGLLLTSLTDRRNPVIRLTSSGKATLEIKCCGCGRAGVRMIFIGNPERDLCRNPDTPVLKLSQ